jgi:hypothetical protein
MPLAPHGQLQITPETNPLRETLGLFLRFPATFLFPEKLKEKTHATRKTRH